jgi:molybdopterin-guanine dinucleotide biosynthesis protein A
MIPTLAILAGGAGSRMGQPKANLRIHDQPILKYLLDRFQWKGPTLLVTAPGREHPPGHDRFTAEAIDPVPEQGPLRGIHTALEHTSTSIVVIATIDMPAVGPEQFDWLISRLADHPDAVAVMPQHGGRIEPFPSIFRIAAISTVQGYLASARLSVQTLADRPRVVTVPVPADWDEIVWTNLNRPEELDAFTRRSGRADR